jgi:hypothetical protein
MGRHNKVNSAGRSPARLHHTNGLTRAKHARHEAPRNKRARVEEANLRLPFMPPEDWHEPVEDGRAYRVIIQPPGPGYRHVLTPEDVRQRLSQLPAHFTRNLEVVQFSRMTRKKQSFPCYGMQWGTSIYLYPIEESLVEDYSAPPKPNLINEARMYGGQWVHETPGSWKLVWTQEAIRDFYLNNILIHELGHLVDDRNSRYLDRERYAEWFAVRYGYQASRRPTPKRPTVRRHG